MISYFDLHCDTLREAYINGYSLDSSPLHISLEKARNFKKYIQVTAIWSDCELNDHDAYLNYRKILNYAKNQGISFASSFTDLNDHPFILAIEDARIIENDLSRIEEFYKNGVRFMTLNWANESIIGGAWNTNTSLSELGEKAVLKCFEVGIIPDISHSSRETVQKVFSLAEANNKKIVATHSNSFSVCNHQRNLTDEEFLFFVKTSSIVGISMCPSHISNNPATIYDILRHIDHYLMLGGENTVCFGCDFDGISSLPEGISDISDMEKVYYSVLKSFGEKISNKIFFENAFNFMRKNLN